MRNDARRPLRRRSASSEQTPHVGSRSQQHRSMSTLYGPRPSVPGCLPLGNQVSNHALPRAPVHSQNPHRSRLALPELPEELFVQAIHELVSADADWVPGGADQTPRTGSRSSAAGSGTPG